MQNVDQSSHIAHQVADGYAAVPQVAAVAWAGSQVNRVADPGSDIDLYVYVTEEIPLSRRLDIAMVRGEQPEVGNAFWEPGDEWIERDSGVHIDVMFRHTQWIEAELARVLQRHEASVGYSTCIWHNVRVSRALFDRTGWFGRLHASAQQPYPEALRQAIIAKNAPLLATTHSSYLYQITRAAERDDAVSLNHRVAALLASYFDILFALNRQTHPGEKRLVALVLRDCPLRPDNMAEQVDQLIAAVGLKDRSVVERARAVVEGLQPLLRHEGCWRSQA